MSIIHPMPFAVRSHLSWKLRRRTLPLGARTVVMGILNVTPDSFSDGGLDASREAAVERGLGLLDLGAEILDVGGESTRPGAVAIGVEEELDRLMPVLLEVLRSQPEAILSIDTYHAATARAAVDAGVEIVNDVSGHLWDAAMGATCAELACGCVLMHTRGRPIEWLGLPALESGAVVPLVLDGLKARVEEAVAAGIARACLAVDPGFGFGKLGDANFSLLAGLDRMASLGLPMVAGLSRKRFLAPEQPPPRMTQTIAAHTAAILGGAHILRVHDVREACEAAAIADAVLRAR